jgi:DNA replication protein DnaC
MNSTKVPNISQQLDQRLHRLGLPTFKENYQKMAERQEAGGGGFIQYLYELSMQEEQRRDENQKIRRLKAAQLPRNKILKDFDHSRLPGLSPALVERLATGQFMDAAENLLIFGNPGTGKSHLSVALAREWSFLGRRILYRDAAKMGEELLEAENQNSLTKLFRKFDRLDCLIVDDISHRTLTRKQARCLFKLISHRYELKSVLLTSNLPFSQWQSIFRDDTTATACIDRLVHHAEILELNARSYRKEKAEEKAKKKNGQ